MREIKNATFVVHWPGKDSLNCDEHAAKLQSLGRHLGFAVSATPCLTDANCANCENEAKVRAERQP